MGLTPVNTPSESAYLSEAALPDFIDLLQRNFKYLPDYLDLNAKELFLVEEIPHNSGGVKLYEEADTETYADYKPEGAQATFGRVDNAYQVTVIPQTFAKAIRITYEMRRDFKYQQIYNQFTNLSKFCENRFDLDLTHILTFGNATSYVSMNGQVVNTAVGDGFPLFYNAHTLAFSPLTYSNRVSGDPAFSQGAFEAAMNLGATQIYNNFGQRRKIDFNSIWCFSGDYGTVRSIKQMLHSTADVTAVQAGIENVYKNSMVLHELSMLATNAAGQVDQTKRRWWGIAAIGQGMNSWQAYAAVWDQPQLRVPAPGNNGENILTLDWVFVAYMAYGIGVLSGRGVIGSLPLN